MAQSQTAAGDLAGFAEHRGTGVSRRRRVPAWLLSATLHAVLFLAAALLIRGTIPIVPAEPDRSAGIVLVQPTASGEPDYFSDTETEPTSSGAVAVAAETPLTEALPNPRETVLDFAGVLPAKAEVTGAGGSLADVLPGAGEMTDGGGQGKNFGGKAQTSVFGIQGTGTKFVYVFDRSGSMEGFGGRPLASAKRELIASLKRLDSIHQFQIIFYNENPSVFNPDAPRAPRLMFGTEREKGMAGRFVQNIIADGGTNHMKALKLAIGMAPDVIFFLTDADEPQLTDDELLQIHRMNRAGATIHAIEFGSTAAPRRDNFLMQLARENDGEHTYVNVTTLPDAR
ncbi:MAG: hypothetical protein RIC55_10060 [Pirellulaceae bacterium]